MRIGMKVSPLSVLMAGIPRYILGLLGGLSEVDEGVNEYFLYTGRPIEQDPGLGERFHLRVVSRPSPSMQAWYQLALPGRLRRDGIEVFHDPVMPLPLASGVPGVITLHDISALVMPGAHSLTSVLSARLLPLYLRKAGRVICVSRFTADELVRRYPGVAPIVRVIHNGVDERFRTESGEEGVERVRRSYHLPERYVLFVGTIEPRKNLSRLIGSFARIAGDVPHGLVIAGGRGWKVREALKGSEGLLEKLNGRIVLPGFVPLEDLPALYEGADLLAYPSLYEGFGLPVVEAMASGTPVLTSSTSSMPEVAAGCALLVDPLSEDSIAEGLLSLCRDPDLRADLRLRGRERAAHFSWTRCAREVLEVYREVAG